LYSGGILVDGFFYGLILQYAFLYLKTKYFNFLEKISQ